jgi:CBS domain-containing protein
VSTLRDITLVRAAVPRSASVAEAAATLRESGLAAIAVLDERERVTGLFTDLDLLRALFPAYLDDVHHTAFLVDDSGLAATRAAQVRDSPVVAHQRRPIVLELDTSATHAAERFLHCEESALAVVDQGRFMGMLSRSELSIAVLRRLTEAPEPGRS